MTSCNFNISYINPYPYSHTMSAKIPSAASLSRIVLRRIPAVFSKTVLTIFRQFNFFLFDISLTPSPGFSLTPVYFSLLLPLFPFKCTTCTNHTFDCLVIHFIHINPPKLCGKLSTSRNVDFTPFRSYTPSYPHYPQVFSSPPVDFTLSLYLFYFCEHLIKFTFPTTFLPNPIDKPGRLHIVFELLYTFFYLFKFSHFSCILVVFYRILCYT